MRDAQKRELPLRIGARFKASAALETARITVGEIQPQPARFRRLPVDAINAFNTRPGPEPDDGVIHQCARSGFRVTLVGGDNYPLASWLGNKRELAASVSTQNCSQIPCLRTGKTSGSQFQR